MKFLHSEYWCKQGIIDLIKKLVIYFCELYSDYDYAKFILCNFKIFHFPNTGNF
jgi:hypothetical protein